jgi:hypothetical protein
MAEAIVQLRAIYLSGDFEAYCREFPGATRANATERAYHHRLLERFRYAVAGPSASWRQRKGPSPGALLPCREERAAPAFERSARWRGATLRLLCLF